MSARVLRRLVVPLASSLLVLWAGIAPPAAAAEAAHSPGAVSLELYGAYTPGVTSSNGGSWWGYGGAARWAVTERWGFALDASRFVLEGRSISPFVAGVTYSPRRSSTLRPWVELGAGYYRRLVRGPIIRNIALGSSGNPRDQFLYPPRETTSVLDGAGGYFGAGLDLSLSSRVGVDLGARAHNWNESGTWTGMLAFRSGVSLRLW